METVHLGKRYACNRCEYSVNEKGLLRKHMEIEHPCEECKATRAEATRAGLKEEKDGSASCNHWTFSISYTGKMCRVHNSENALYLHIRNIMRNHPK